MDLIMQLPPTADGNMAIIVFCDKFTKMIHVVPAKTKCDGPEVANIFFKHVFQYHGMPEQFIHDRDPRFTSSLWKTLFHLCGIKQTNSTANFFFFFFLQTDSYKNHSETSPVINPGGLR